MADEPINPLQPINTAPVAVRNILKKVLQLEKERLYDDRPRLIEDVVTIIKQEVRDDS
jgi:hypothetical protein